MKPETDKKIEEMQKQIDSLLQDREFFKLHTHNGFDSTKLKFVDMDNVVYKNETINPSSLADGAGQTVQVTGVVGATLGDWVLISAPYDLQDITVTGYVQANDIVEIRIQNESGSTVDLASGVWRILVIKKII